jgi:hypothetical protein
MFPHGRAREASARHMAGPFGVLRIHDLRDWAQRQKECHDFYAHRRSYLKDIFWQLTYRFDFTHPPEFKIEDELAGDRWCQFLETTWRFHQLMLAIPLYLLGMGRVGDICSCVYWYCWALDDHLFLP